MTQIYLYVADLVAIGVLTFALYFPRHRRRDLLVAYLVVNIGVLAVTSALISSDATLGLGLGLFGVLSIIRLRSAESGVVNYCGFSAVWSEQMANDYKAAFNAT